MASLPLDVHQVLEEEYVSMYDKPLPRIVHYDQSQIRNAEEVCRKLRPHYTGAADKTAIAVQLNAWIDSAVPDELAKGTRGAELLKLYDKEDPHWTPEEVRRVILDDVLQDCVQPLRDVRLDQLYTNVHARQTPRAALCISGGGIRSATFALGVIQGLASAGVLKKFDYLSTVSGGGYIGSWLSSWVRRHPKGMTGVEDDLHAADTAITGVIQHGEPKPRDPESPKIDPEPAPVRHLREYSNYLSPRLGILSADSWTLASHYVRNLLLNLLVLVPLLALALAIPRFFHWGVEYSDSLAAPDTYVWIALVFAAVAFGCIGAARPLERGTPATRNVFASNKAYLIGVVLPLLVASCSLAMYWANVGKPDFTPLTLRHGIGAFAAMVAVPFLVYYGRMFFVKVATRRVNFGSVVRKAFFELIAVSVALGTAGVLFYLLALKVFPDPMRLTPDGAFLSPLDRLAIESSPQAQLYACFAVPLALLVFFVQASIFVGLSSKANEDADREWWGRGGALLLMVSIGMAIFNAISVFGPVALYHAPAILGATGGIAGIVAAILGFSDKTPANQKQKEKAGAAATAGNVSSAVLIPLFVVFILAAISLGSTWLIHKVGESPVNETAMAQQLAMQYEYSNTTETTANGKSETKNTLGPQPYTTRADLNTYAHLFTMQHANGRQLLIFLVVGLGAAVLSLCIGVNKFSMHALYRNRLIRAYLGASRHSRTPDRFTGFDENDNLQMWQLRPEIYWRTDIHDDFPARLHARTDTFAVEIKKRLQKKTRDGIGADKVTDGTFDLLVQDLNHIVLNDDLDAKPLTTQIVQGRAWRNRNCLDREFAGLVEPIRPHKQRGPVHVINTALNLTTGENLGWQQRMAESFTVSPYHTGSLYVGYRSSHEYGGDQGISLGTAVTISGAAASPNMGYHSSPAMAFIMTMFNIRLGSWLGNPGLRGQKKYRKAHPTSNLRPLAHELTGGSNDQARWIYLSDGGHFENLGLYEMILRRCRYIVVSDAGADPKFSFDDLGNAVRKIRTDLGVPVDICDVRMQPRTADGQFGEGQFVARASIRYGVVDKNCQEDGTLIYIKTGVYKNDTHLPQDIYNYAQESLAFPHEPTSDQFFSESQFESYRALGRHVVNVICDNYQEEVGKPTPRIPIAKRYESIAQFDSAVGKRISVSSAGSGTTAQRPNR